MRVLVLGATGFIGGHVARCACQSGLKVHGLRRRPGAVGMLVGLPVTWHEGDLADRSSLEAAMRSCDVLFHAAAYYPYTERNTPRAMQQAVKQMRQVLEAARRAGIRRVVYTSSLTTIGPPPVDSDRMADERDGYVPGSTHNAYYEAKWAMEHEALRATLAGLPVIILCPTAVIGPGDTKGISRLLVALARGRLPFGIDAESNVVDARDVGLAHVQAATHGTPGERYIIGGHNLNLTQALREAAILIGVRPPRWSLSKGFASWLLQTGALLGLPIPETVRAVARWQPLNAEKGWQVLGFTPRPFAETVHDTVAWLRENRLL